MRWKETISVAAMMNLSLPVVAPGTTPHQAQTCPPKPGLEYHSRIANGASMRWYSGLIQKVDFKGNIQIALLPGSNDRESVDVRVLGLREEGESIERNRYILELARADDTSKSTLQCSQTNPSKMTLTYVMDLVLTASDPDGTEVTQLRTKDPAVQSVELNRWPPNGEVFELQRPIEFFFSDGQFGVTIDKYPTQERGGIMH